jgi:hypothetical protein
MSFFDTDNLPVFVAPEPPKYTGEQLLYVFVPLRGKRTPENIIETIERTLAEMMKKPPVHVGRDPKPLRMKWWHIWPSHQSHWTFEAEDITDPSGTAAVIGELSYKYPDVHLVYVR